MGDELFTQIIQACLHPDGWKTNLLLVPGKKPLRFVRTVVVRLRHVDDGCECEVTDVDLQLPVNHGLDLKFADLAQEAERPRAQLIAVAAMTPEMALVQAHNQILITAKRFIHTPSHKLSDDEMALKGLFIGFIDLIETEVVKLPTERWQSCRLVRKDGELLVVPVHSDFVHLQFKVPQEYLRETEETGGDWALALIECDRGGYLTGPVVKIESRKDVPYAELMERLARLQAG